MNPFTYFRRRTKGQPWPTKSQHETREFLKYSAARSGLKIEHFETRRSIYQRIKESGLDRMIVEEIERNPKWWLD